MSWNWFNFRSWLERVRAALRGRGRRQANRSPLRKEGVAPAVKLELAILEHRESFGDISLTGLVAAAGAAGAAGFLFGAAALMMREPRVEQSLVDNALLGAGTAREPLTAGLLDETLPAGLFQATATWTPSGTAVDDLALDEFFAAEPAGSDLPAPPDAAALGQDGLNAGALAAALHSLEQPLSASDEELAGDDALRAALNQAALAAGSGAGTGASGTAGGAATAATPTFAPGAPLESTFPTDPAYGNTPPLDDFLNTPPLPEAPPAPPPDLGPPPATLPNLGEASLFFEANQGQVGNDQVQFFARGDAYSVFLSATEANFVLHPAATEAASAAAAPSVLRMEYVGANSAAAFVGEERLSGVTNYLVGDASQWVVDVANYGSVRQDDVYAGIDLRYYANAQQQLEYDFIVSAGANVADIRLAFSGNSGLELDAQGNLVLHTGQGNVIQQAPVIYQEVAGARQTVTGRYVLHADQTVGFEVDAYDTSAALIVDPVVFSTYHGGSGSQDFGNSIAADSAGNSYLGGTTNSSNFPILGGYDSTLSGSHDAFVTKFDAQGQRVYSTFLGGSGLDQGFGIKVDGSGQVYLAGATGSTNFPTTGSAYDATKNANDDVYLTKLNAAGNGLLYSTYYGGAGTDQGWALAIDGAGMAYLTGLTTSSDLPASGSYQGAQDTFVAAFDTTQSGASSLVWSTYLGGSAIELGRGLAVDGSGNVTVGGYTESTGLGTTGAFQDTKSGGRDGFIAQLDNTGSLVYWTYLGGSSTDEVHSLALDPDSNVYATGLTSSTNFPTLNPFQTDKPGQDGFITKLTADGSALEYSTYFGGNGTDVGTTIAVDALGQAHIIGKTTSANLPLARAAQWVYGGNEDAFVAKLDCHGASLLFSSYWGGSAKDQGCSIALDAEGCMLVSGITASTNLPTVAPAQGSLASADDVWVAKFCDPQSVVLQSDPYQADWLALGGLAYVNLLDGAFRKEVPVQTDQSPNLPSGGGGNNTPNPMVGASPGSASRAPLSDHNLVYNSATVDPRPIIVSTVYLRCDDPNPTQIDVTLTWDGVTQSTQTFTVPGSLNGPYLVAVQAPSTTGGWDTGLYSWTVDVTYTLPDTTVVAAGTTTGTAIVVNRSASEFGPGWSVAGASDAVVAVNDGNGNTGVLMIDGRTSYARFFRTGTGGTFVSPANDFGTLVQNGDGSFTYTAKDKTVFRYNAAGLITEFEDTHGLKTLYGRNGSGQLTTLTLADGAVSTWSYSGGLLSSITMPLGTLTVVSRDGDGNPTDIELTDDEHWTATYATPSGFSQPLIRFDPWGPLAATVTFDSGGRITTFDRGLGSVHNITPQGVQALGTTARSAADNVATVNQPMSGSVSRTNTYTLDAQGRTTQRVNPDATTRKLDYDFAGNLARFTDESSRTTTYSYAYGANKGDLTRITRPDGTAVNFAYETTFHHITEYTDSLGRKTTWTFDPVTGDLLTEKDALGQTTTYTYYETLGVSNGLVESITNPRGFTTTYLYDASRRPTETIDALNHRTTFTYDTAGNIQTVKDALGRVTTAAYDGLRRQTLEIDALGKSTTYAYNAIGQLTSLVDRLGRTTSLIYDQRGWLTSVTEALATAEQRTTNYLYDFVGNLLTLTDPRGVATSFAYDTRDRLVQRIDAFSAPTNLPGLGHASPVTTFAYDAVSNLLSITNPRGFVTSFAYDVRDRQTRVIEAFGNTDQRTVTTAYDAESNIVAVTDGRGVKTSFTYDVLNRLATRIDAATVPGGLPALNHASPVTTYSYDPNDNLLSVIDPRGVTTSFAYDALDRRTRMIEAFAAPMSLPGLNHASPVWTYVYDDVDNLLSVTDARGVTTSYAYDVLNRRTAIHEAFSAPTTLPGLNHAPPVTTFTFDAVGNVLSLTDARGVTTSFAYDALDRRVTTIEAFSAPTNLPGLNHTPPVTTYAYDANDNVVGITDARGVGTSLTYDALNRLATRTDAATAPTGLPGLNHASPVTTFAYDIGSNLLSVTDARGVTTSFAYDALDRRVRRIDAFSAPTNLPALNHASPVWTYVFDKADNLLSVTDPRGVRTSYAYDALNRLSRVVEADAQPGGLAALNHGKPTTTFVYDIGSNLLSVVDPRGVTTSFSYDALNRRVTVIEAFSAPTDLPGLNHAAPTSTFVYDQVGNQLSMTNARGVTTSMAYDALNRLTTVIEAFSAPTSLPGLNHASPISTFVYDSVGNQLSLTDARGVTTSFAYDALNRLTQFFEAFSAPTGLPGLNHAPPVTTLVYDQVGNQLSLTDARGVTTSFAYDALNRLATSIEAFAAPTTLPGLNHAAPVTTRVYDIASNLLSVTDARNVTTSFAYDALNRVARRIEAFSAPTSLPGLNHASPVTTYLYDIASNVLSVTDPRGVVTSYAYDALNRVARVRDAHSAPTNLPALNHAVPVTSYIYDIGSNVLSVTDPRGVTTSFAYDALNRVSRRIDAFSAPTTLPGLNHASPVTTFVYDEEDNLLSATDPRGVTTSYAYDALNRQVKRIDAFSAPTALPALGHASPVTTFAFDIASNLLSVTNPRGFTTSFAYDALNREAKRIEALGTADERAITTVYDANSNAVALTDGRGNTMTMTYDALNRQVNYIDALNNRTTTVYDAVSNVIRAIDEEGHATTFTYDALNRSVLTQRPNGQLTTLVYDVASNLVRTDVLASTTAGLTVESTTYAYDALNRLAKATDARNGVTTLVYDIASNRIALIDPVGNRTTLVYDALNREVKRTDPLNQNTTFVYDVGSLLVQKIDRNGRECDYAYDALGRLALGTWKDTVGGSTVNLFTYTYDLNSNTLTAADFDGNYTFTYDSLDRLATQRDLFGKTLTFTYDKADNRVQVADSEGGIATSVYDADNRLTSRQFSVGGATPVRFDYAYTARDQVASITRYSDLAGTTQVGSTLHTYDESMRVTNIQHRDATDATLANYTYTYDVADRLSSETRNGVLRDYGYNATDELTQDGTATFTYDLNGNRTLAGYVTGANNRLLSDGVYTYTYDSEGNQTQRRKLDGTDVWDFTYDHNNQLVSAEHRPSLAGSVDQSLSFKYDVFANRIERSDDPDGVGAGSATVERFGYDGRDVWADLDGSNSLTARRIWGDGVNDPQARISGATVAYYLQDRLGSIREIANNSTGALLYEATLSAYGKVESEVSAANGDRYLYAGYQLERGLNLYYVTWRFYDPNTGRFNSEDPIRDGTNPFAYVGNGPTNAVDPFGLAEMPLSTQERAERRDRLEDLFKQFYQSYVKHANAANRALIRKDEETARVIVDRLSSDPKLTNEQYLQLLGGLKSVVWRFESEETHPAGTHVPLVEGNEPGRKARFGDTQQADVRQRYIAMTELALRYWELELQLGSKVQELARQEIAHLTDLKRRLETKPVLDADEVNKLAQVEYYLIKQQETKRIVAGMLLKAEVLRQQKAQAEFDARMAPYIKKGLIGPEGYPIRMSEADKAYFSQFASFKKIEGEYEKSGTGYIDRKYKEGQQPLGYTPAEFKVNAALEAEGLQTMLDAVNVATTLWVFSPTRVADVLKLTSMLQSGPIRLAAQAGKPGYVVNNGLPPSMPSYTAQGNPGRTTGLLIFQENGQTRWVQLTSGINNATEAGLAGARNLPGATTANWYHVEFQALELMRQRGIANASLLHNYPSGLPCGACMPGGDLTRLQSSLANGSQINIFGLTPSPAGSTRSPWMVSPAGSVRVSGTR